MKMTLMAAGLSLLASIAFGAPTLQLAAIEAGIEPEQLPGYDSLNEAALHAIERDYQCSRAYECGGVIALRPDGKYVVGPVSSNFAGDHVEVQHRVPKGWKLIADQHTHPCLPQSHEVPYFSPDDLIGDISERVIGIMGDLCTGEVHLFNPASDSPNNEELPANKGVYATRGHIIGKIEVDGVKQEPDTGL